MCPSLVEVALPFASICPSTTVRAPSEGWEEVGPLPRVFSFIYCLLFLQIQASAAPSGSRGFTLKVSSGVSLFLASFRSCLFSSLVSPSGFLSLRPPVLRWLLEGGRGLVPWALRWQVVTACVCVRERGRRRENGAGSRDVGHRSVSEYTREAGGPTSQIDTSLRPLRHGPWGSTQGLWTTALQQSTWQIPVGLTPVLGCWHAAVNRPPGSC